MTTIRTLRVRGLRAKISFNKPPNKLTIRRVTALLNDNLEQEGIDSKMIVSVDLNQTETLNHIIPANDGMGMIKGNWETFTYDVRALIGGMYVIIESPSGWCQTVTADELKIMRARYEKRHSSGPGEAKPRPSYDTTLDGPLPTTMILAVYWQPATGPQRHTRMGEVQMDADDLPEPPLTEIEMQNIAYAAKMEYGRILRNRKYGRRKPKPSRYSDGRIKKELHGKNS